MTQYVSYITVGNQPDALRDYLCKSYGVTSEEAQTILDSEPYGGFRSSEERYQWIRRTVGKIKALPILNRLKGVTINSQGDAV